MKVVKNRQLCFHEYSKLSRAISPPFLASRCVSWRKSLSPLPSSAALPLGTSPVRHGSYQISRAVAADTALPPKKLAPVSGVTEAIDFTKLAACIHELQQQWVPAKVHQVVMADKETLAVKLRAVDKTGWLYLSWHPMAARLCMGDDPDRGEASEAFPFAKQINSMCAAA